MSEKPTDWGCPALHPANKGGPYRLVAVKTPNSAKTPPLPSGYQDRPGLSLPVTGGTGFPTSDTGQLNF